MEDLQWDSPGTSGSGMHPERERQLGHLLQLERERRIQAEQQVEVEKQLCLELHHQLSLERRLHSTSGSYPTSPTHPPLPLAPPPIGRALTNTSRGPTPCGHARSNSKNDVGTPSNISGDPPRNGSVISPGPLSSLSDDFSSAVFSQLPSDLQKMLGVKNAANGSLLGSAPHRTTLSKAMDAVKANDPQSLLYYLENLETGDTREARDLEREEETGIKYSAASEWDMDAQSLLDTASERGHTACVRVLLAAGYSPDTCYREDGMTPLHLAAINGHVDSLRLLLEWGGYANPQDSKGETPLFLALCEGRRQCLDSLLEAGSSLQVVTTSGYTVLHAAVSGNLPDTLRTLLVHLRTSLAHSEIYCVVNHRDKDGNTALHLAVSRGYKRCAEVLCASPDVDLTLRDRWNRTALDISTEDCRELLLNKECKEVTVCIDRNGSRQQTTDCPLPSSIAIGKITILRHHKWSDVELLVEEAMRQYCYYLKGSWIVKPSTSSRVSKPPNVECEDVEFGPCRGRTSLLSSGTQNGSPEDKPYYGGRASALSEAIRRELWHSQEGGGFEDLSQMLVDSHQKLSRMDLTAASIASYRIGQTTWKPGELPLNLRLKNLFGLFSERRNSITRIGRSNKTLNVHISLKGSSEKCLDQLAFDFMIPIATLKEYVELLESQRLLMLHGPQGSGKTLLAKGLAEHLKYQLGTEKTQVVHAPLHPSFRRDDLFRLLHLNGLLVLAEDNQTAGETRSSLHPKPYILLLDDVDKTSALEHGVSEVLAELLSLLDHSGHAHPVWVAGVHSRDGALLYPSGRYCLREKCYVIATKTCASPKALHPSVASCFPHAPLGLVEEPSSGVLYRQMMARLLHATQGAVPHRSDELYRAVQWVWEVWLVYNHFLLRLDLPELTIGVRHFIQCPIEPGDCEGLYSWLCKVWNTHLAPWIEDTLLSSNQTEGNQRQKTINSLLAAITHKVFRMTCPLGPEGTACLLQRLRGDPGGMAATRAKRKKGLRNGVPPPLQTVNSYPSPPPHGPRSVSPTTPTSSLVAYEELARNSPKALRNKKTSLRVSLSMDQINRSSSVDGVKLRDNGGKMGTLRKLRTKTLSLFSRDSGGTLPRLFRRGSRTSLASVAEEDISRLSEGDTSQGLTDIFDRLSLASSDRMNDQRSPVPLAPTRAGRNPTLSHANPSPLSKHVLPTYSSSPNRTSPLLYSTGVMPVHAPIHSMPDLSTAHEVPPSPVLRPRQHGMETAAVSIKVDIQQGSNICSEASSKQSTPDDPCTANEDEHHTLMWRRQEACEFGMENFPLEPKSEPLQRRTLTPANKPRESSSVSTSVQTTPETIKKVSTRRPSHECTLTSPCGNGTAEEPTPRKLFPSPENVRFDDKHIKANSTDAILLEHADAAATQELFRTVSDGKLRRRSAFKRDGTWSQHTRASLEQRRNSKTKGIATVRENGFERSPETDEDGWAILDQRGERDLEYSSSCERMSDTSSVRSATLLFSASLGFCSPDSPILKTASLQQPLNSREPQRLTNPRPSITMMDLFTDESMAEM